jgi:MoaA/NifB/PqqE/SkfB family radical SAM enzyme
MWTRKSTKLGYEVTPPIEFRNFIERNPVYMRHHEKSTARIEQVISKYQQNGIVDEANICKLVIKMTSKCNMRCKHCFQWRENGFHHEIDPTAIPFAQCGHIFDFVERNKPDIILTGGEATSHPDFEKFIHRFAQMGCYIHLCTNGLKIEKYFDLFEKYHNQLTFLISLDGTEEIHDSVRGKGSWKKTIANIKFLTEAKDSGMDWLIGIENTLMPSNLDNALELKSFCENIGVDWMIFNHLWIVDSAARDEYINFCAGYDTIPKSFTGFDSGPFSDEYVAKVNETIDKIKESERTIPIYFGPDFSPDEVYNWYMNKYSAMPSYLKMGCKLDIDIGGELVMTKQFPDISFGNVLEHPIEELLRSDKYQSVATKLRSSSLRILSACSDTHNLKI